MFDAARERLFRWWAGVVSRRAGWVLAVAGLLAVAAVVLTVFELEFHSNRNDLIDQDLPWNVRYVDWVERFPGNTDFYVIVDVGAELGDPGYDERRGKAEALAGELADGMIKADHVEDVVWRFDEDLFSPRTVRLLSRPRFERRLNDVADAKYMLGSRTPQAMLAAIAGELGQLQNAANSKVAGDTGGAGGAGGEFDLRAISSQIVGVQDLLAAITQRLESDADQPTLGDLMNGDESGSYQYLESDNGRMLFLRVTPVREEGGINAMGPAIASIRKVMADVTPRHPDVEAGLTGIEVVEADETDAAIRDSTIASIVAFVLIASLLVLAFQSVRTPVLAMIALLIGVAWAFGYTTLAVGHLQLISVVVAVILMGLGIDFGIHYIARFERVRHGFPDTPEGCGQTLGDSFNVMGPGIMTGAVTTAAAFVMTAFTDFKGVAEMGVIAAGGVVLCLIAMFSAFPALLRLFKGRHKHVTPIEQRKVTFFNERWMKPVSRRPIVVLVVAGVVLAASIWPAYRVANSFDFNLMNLQPHGVPSVTWQQRVTRDGGESIWTGTCITDDLDKARKLANELRAQPTIGSTMRGIGLLFPVDEDEKLDRLRQVRASIAGPLQVAEEDLAPDRGPPLDEAPDLLGRVSALYFTVSLAVNQDMPEPLRVELRKILSSMQKLVAVGASLTPDQRKTRLDRLREEYWSWRADSTRRILSMLDTSPLEADDMPDELMRPYVARDADDKAVAFALEVPPKIDPQLYPGVNDPLHPDYLPDFIDDLMEVDPEATGVIVQVYESGDLIFNAYQRAGLYALAAVFLLVLLDFRSVVDALLCLVPVAAGFLVTFGIMHVVGTPINAANIIVLPLMFGIGVDAGVHIIHRARMNPSDRPIGLTAGTGKGITISTLTTMIGFGALMIASHRGIASLGFVMSVGLGMTLMACWFVMPACLEVRQRRRERGAEKS